MVGALAEGAREGEDRDAVGLGPAGDLGGDLAPDGLPVEGTLGRDDQVGAGEPGGGYPGRKAPDQRRCLPNGAGWS